MLLPADGRLAWGMIGAEPRHRRHTFEKEDVDHVHPCRRGIGAQRSRASGSSVPGFAALMQSLRVQDGERAPEGPWLFDRLGELASADHMDVVIGVTTPSTTLESAALVDLILRIGRLPRTTLLLLPENVIGPTLPFATADVVEPDRLTPKLRRRAVSRMLAKHRRYCGAVLRVDDCRLVLEPYARLPISDRRPPAWRPGGVSGILATHGPGGSDQDNAATVQLSMGTGPSAPQLALDPAGLVLILDALITLRELAVDCSQSSPSAEVPTTACRPHLAAKTESHHDRGRLRA